MNMLRKGACAAAVCATMAVGEAVISDTLGIGVKAQPLVAAGCQSSPTPPGPDGVVNAGAQQNFAPPQQMPPQQQNNFPPQQAPQSRQQNFFPPQPQQQFGGPQQGINRQAGEQVFHAGERVIVTPYGGEWWYCTIAGERVGNPPANFSYTAVCDPWPRNPGEKPLQQTHLFSAERVKALDDPAAVAGIAQMKVNFPAGADSQP